MQVNFYNQNILVFIFYFIFADIIICIMKTQLCPHCGSEVITSISKCTICGKPIPDVVAKTVYEPGYALVKQNLKLAKLMSVILSLLMIVLYASPFINRTEFVTKYFGENVFPFLILALVVLLSLWQILFVYTYLLNFYHRFANIFTNIRWEIIAIIIIVLLVVSAIVADTLNASGLQNGEFVYKDMSTYLNIQIILSLFIAAYVFWAFVHAITGWILADSREVDFVGGLPALGYFMLASAIIPAFIIFVPFCISNIFFKANRYSEKYGFIS